MTTKDNGGPAFPTPSDESPFGDFVQGQQGMTLRDYFAAKAMQSVLHVAFENGVANNPEVANPIAKASYAMADAMLEARK